MVKLSTPGGIYLTQFLRQAIVTKPYTNIQETYREKCGYLPFDLKSALDKRGEIKIIGIPET